MEIIYQLAVGILDGLVFLHKRRLYVEDLRPCYVGRENTHGQRWFICDRLNKPSGVKASTNDHIVNGDPLYCAPEVIRSLKGSHRSYYHSRSNSNSSPVLGQSPSQPTSAQIKPESCDVWAYGMMVLQAGTLDDLQECYDKPNFDFRDQVLENY